MTQAPQPAPGTLHVPDGDLDDLRQRLARTRFPDEAPGEPWAYGTSVAYMEELVRYWSEGFDWRAQEARLNALPQYRVPLHGIDLHVLHVPGVGPDPCPLLLSHGWPGSVFEFLDIIPRLTDPARFGGDPADAFTVVAPSLPGYGLSFAPGQPRFGVEAIADCFAALMTDVLGYGRFAAQGGDWGSFVTARLGHAYPERMIGIHLNLLPVRRDPAALANPTSEEARYLQELAVFLKEETGYQWIQGTRPQTLAFGLTDSPAGLAAWVMEKFRAWSDCGGDVESVFTKDQLLANISLYWFTGHRLVVLALLRAHAWALADPGRRDGRRPDRILRVPARDPAAAPLACRARVHPHRALERDAPRRPFRRPGAAGRARGRDPRLLPHAAPVTALALSTQAGACASVGATMSQLREERRCAPRRGPEASRA